MNIFSPGLSEPPLVDTARLMEDPHKRLAELRSEFPVVRIKDHHYAALRAPDVQTLLTDPRTQQIEGNIYVSVQQIPDGTVARLLSDTFLLSNDTDHRTKRGLFAKAFARAPILEKEPAIRAVARDIVADLPRNESFDFIATMASRVPAEMIAQILGLPREDAAYFAPLVYRLTRALNPIYPIAEHENIEAAGCELYSYIEQQLTRRVASPREDFLSALVAEWLDSHPVPFETLVNQVLTIVLGGSDTTRAAFAMTIALLLERPEAWNAVKADPSLIGGAVAEALRYEPSVAGIPRFTVADIEIDGFFLPKGVRLDLNTMSAMRDPALYEAPDRFDIRRTDHPRLHAVFGLGPHRCIGEVLARLEMEASLAALIEGAPDIELETAPQMLGFGGLRQITPMQVRIR